MKAQNFQVQAQAVEVVARKGGAIEQGMKAWATMTPEQKEKCARFMQAYGATPSQIQSKTGLTQDEQAAALERFKAAYPRIAELMKQRPLDNPDFFPGVH